VIAVGEPVGPDAVELALQLVVYVEVGSNGALQVLLFHAGVSTFDYVEHLGAVRIELIVALRRLWPAPRSQKLVYHAPKEKLHLLLDKVL
jgi:hypothetical protein